MFKFNDLLGLIFLAFIATACGGQLQDEELVGEGAAPDEALLDSENASFANAGKADWIIPEDGSKEADAVLALVNSADFDTLDAVPPAGVGLHATAAQNIIAHRDGDDATPNTADDRIFMTLADLDSVRYVGLYALEQLLAYAHTHGLIDIPAQPPVFKIVGEQFTTEQAGHPEVAGGGDNFQLLSHAKAPGKGGRLFSLLKMNYIDGKSFETLGNGFELKDHDSPWINRSNLAQGATHNFYCIGEKIGDLRARGAYNYFSHQRIGGADQDTVVSQGPYINDRNPLIAASNGIWGAALHSPGYSESLTQYGIYFAIYSDDFENSKAEIGEGKAVTARALAFSPTLNRFVAVYAYRNGNNDEIYSVTVKPKRNFNAPATPPALITTISPASPDSPDTRLPMEERDAKLVWDGDGFAYFYVLDRTLKMIRLNPGGQPVGEPVDVLPDITAFDAIYDQGQHIVVATAIERNRPYAHYVDKDGVRLSSLRLSDEPAANPDLTTVTGGYIAAWTDPTDFVNVIRIEQAN